MRLLGPTLLLSHSLAGSACTPEQGEMLRHAVTSNQTARELVDEQGSDTGGMHQVQPFAPDFTRWDTALPVIENGTVTPTESTPPVRVATQPIPPVSDTPPVIAGQDCFILQGPDDKSYLFCGPLASADVASAPTGDSAVDLGKLISGESKGDDIGKVFAELDWKKGIGGAIAFIGGLFGFIYSGRKMMRYKAAIAQLHETESGDKKTEQERQKQLFQNNAMRMLSLGVRIFCLPAAAIVSAGVIFGAGSLITFGVGILALSLNAFIVIAKEPLNNLFYSGFLKLNQSKFEHGEEIEVEGMRFIYQGVDGQHVFGDGIDDVGDTVTYIVPSSLVFNKPGKNFKKLSPKILSIEPHRHFASITLKDGASVYGKVVAKTDMILVVESLNDKGHKLRRFIRLNDVNDNTFQLFDGPQPLEFILHGITVRIGVGDKITQLGTTPEITGTLLDFNDDVLALKSDDGSLLILPRSILMKGIKIDGVPSP